MNFYNLKRKRAREKKEIYIEPKVVLTCCFSGSVCHKNIRTETNEMIVPEKQLLKVFHNIECEPF